MSNSNLSTMRVVLVEEELQFTLIELGHACHAETQRLVELVEEGVLTPSGEGLADWRFAGVSLRRARTALRLMHELELTAPAVALVLDLLDRIDGLRSRLRQAGLS